MNANFTPGKDLYIANAENLFCLLGVVIIAAYPVSKAGYDCGSGSSA